MNVIGTCIKAVAAAVVTKVEELAELLNNQCLKMMFTLKKDGHFIFLLWAKSRNGKEVDCYIIFHIAVCS